MFKRSVYIVLLVLLMPYDAYAQTIFEMNSLSFGRLRVPLSGGVVEIDPDNTISQGSSLVIGGPPRRGRYRFFAFGGSNIDIDISGVTSCDPSVTVADFDANYDSTDYNDISTNPIVGASYGGNDVILLGARVTYGAAAPIGVCNVNFDLNVTTY